MVSLSMKSSLWSRIAACKQYQIHQKFIDISFVSLFCWIHSLLDVQSRQLGLLNCHLGYSIQSFPAVMVQTLHILLECQIRARLRAQSSKLQSLNSLLDCFMHALPSDHSSKLQTLSSYLDCQIRALLGDQFTELQRPSSLRDRYIHELMSVLLSKPQLLSIL